MQTECNAGPARRPLLPPFDRLRAVIEVERQLRDQGGLCDSSMRDRSWPLRHSCPRVIPAKAGFERVQKGGAGARLCGEGERNMRDDGQVGRRSKSRRAGGRALRYKASKQPRPVLQFSGSATWPSGPRTCCVWPHQWMPLPIEAISNGSPVSMNISLQRRRRQY